MIKYNWSSIASYRRNGNFAGFRDYRWHLHRCLRKFSHFILLETAEEAGKRRAFFRAQERWRDLYREHSKELGTALYEWWKGEELTHCEYVDGRFVPHPYVRTRPFKIRNLQFATKHLERSYPDVERNLDQIELRSYELCDEIQRLMHSLYAGSFEYIIEDRIRAVCPSLKRVDDRQKLDDNGSKSGYIDHLMFKLIFKGVDEQDLNSVKSDEIQIHPILDKSKKSNPTYYQLEYQKVCLAVANQEHILSMLKQTIMELISDNRLKEIKDKYYGTYNSQEVNMRDIKTLSDLWCAGNLELPEENYPVCDGCPPKPKEER
jgi:hypothetical protein